MTLLEVLPWKQDIKQKFLSPFSSILKTCAKNPTALSQIKVTSVWPRLFLLKRTATRGGCCLCLQVIECCPLTTHKLDAQFITAFEVLDKYILQICSWELRGSDQLLILSGYILKSPVCSGGHSDDRAIQPWSFQHWHRVVWESYFKTSDSLEVWVSLLIWYLN